jgi:hypothetical protein
VWTGPRKADRQSRLLLPRVHWIAGEVPYGAEQSRNRALRTSNVNERADANSARTARYSAAELLRENLGVAFPAIAVEGLQRERMHDRGESHACILGQRCAKRRRSLRGRAFDQAVGQAMAWVGDIAVIGIGGGTIGVIIGFGIDGGLGISRSEASAGSSTSRRGRSGKRALLPVVSQKVQCGSPLSSLVREIGDFDLVQISDAAPF